MIHIAAEELAFATPPFSWEYIATRSIGRYRIRDSKDNAVGWTETEAEAIATVAELNKPPKIIFDH